MSIKSRLSKLENEVHVKDNEFIMGFKYPSINVMKIPLLNFESTIEEGNRLPNGRKHAVVFTRGCCLED